MFFFVVLSAILLNARSNAKPQIEITITWIG